MKTETRIAFMSKNDTDVMRGLAALLVVFSHYTVFLVEDTQLSNTGLFGTAFKWAGGLGVLIFFSLSGYALWLSYAERAISLDFLLKRFMRIIPVYVSINLLLGWSIFSFNENNGFFEYLQFAFNIRQEWFIEQILVIYVLFFIAMKTSRRYVIPIMIIFLIIISCFYYFYGYREAYYNSNIIFAFGIFVAKYWDKLSALYKKHFILMLCASISFFALFSGVFTILKGNTDFSIIFKPLGGCAFIIALIGIRIHITWNPILLKRLGEMSLQIYLAHAFLWKIVNSYLNSIPISLRVMMALGLTYVFCWGIYAIDMYVRGRLKRI